MTSRDKLDLANLERVLHPNEAFAIQGKVRGLQPGMGGCPWTKYEA